MNKQKVVEKIAQIIVLICAVVAIVAVLSITLYMFMKGTPALKSVGVTELLFGMIGNQRPQNQVLVFYILS